MKKLLDHHVTLFIGQTGCGKTKKVLDLLESDYLNHFNIIVILSSNFEINDTYQERTWIHTDPHIIKINPDVDHS